MDIIIFYLFFKKFKKKTLDFVLKKMRATIWGESFWNLMFDIAHYYLTRRNPLVNKQLIKFYELCAFVLPCHTCRKHYTKYTRNCDYFRKETRKLSKTDIGLHFLFPLKNLINKRLGKIEMLCKTYIKKRKHFPIMGSFKILESLFSILEQELTHDVTLSPQRVVEWRSVTLSLVEPIPNYSKMSFNNLTQLDETT